MPTFGRVSLIKKTSHILLLAGALLLGSCTEKTATEPDTNISSPIKLTLLADWYAEPEHGGFYLALQKGYYRDAGIDLEIISSTNNANLFILVASGQAEFGLGTSDNLAVAVARELPVVGLFPYFQHDPQGVMFHKGAGIQSLADLDGREVMISPVLHYLEFIQRTYDIELKVLPLDYSVARFVHDKNFVQQAFLTSEPYFAIQQGIEPQLLPFWESGLDPYRLVFSNGKFAQDHPDLVEAFVQASLRGWREFMAGDIADTFSLIAERNPQQSTDFMRWTYGEMQRYQLIEGFPERSEFLGQISIPRLAEQIIQLREIGLLDRDISPHQLMWLDNYPDELIRP